MAESETSNSYEDQSSYFFEKYSKDLLVEVKSISGKLTPNPGHALQNLSLGDLGVGVGHMLAPGQEHVPSVLHTGPLSVPENRRSCPAPLYSVSSRAA